MRNCKLCGNEPKPNHGRRNTMLTDTQRGDLKSAAMYIEHLLHCPKLGQELRAITDLDSAALKTIVRAADLLSGQGEHALAAACKGVLQSETKGISAESVDHLKFAARVLDLEGYIIEAGYVRDALKEMGHA